MFANETAGDANVNGQGRPMQQIEFYFDPISPFAYLGSIQIERLAARLGRSVEWKPVLIGVTILKVMGLKPLPETPLKGPYLKHDAVRLAEYFDVPFRYHGLTGINSLAALRAFVVLKERDAGLAKSLAQKIFSRLWVRGLNITEPMTSPRRPKTSALTCPRCSATSRQTTPRTR